MRPYLIGFYLVLNRFRGGRIIGTKDEVVDSLEHLYSLQDRSDMLCKLRGDRTDTDDIDDISGEQVGGRDNGDGRDREPPKVPVTSLLLQNGESLIQLTAGTTPLQVLVHPVQSPDKVSFAGSNASGEGYGGRDDIDGGESSVIGAPPQMTNRPIGGEKCAPAWVRYAVTPFRVVCKDVKSGLQLTTPPLSQD